MRYARTCSALIAPSRSVAADVRAVVGTELPIYSIWNAVDLERFSPDGGTLDLDGRCGLPPSGADVVRVGLVATFARWKGHHVFLEAIARLPPSLHVRAYVIGGPVYETGKSEVSIEELRKASARLGIADRVGFTGFIEDPAPAIRALDVVVHASTEPEPFGLAIAEGMACGRAVVVSAGGGAAELVTAGVDALTFTPGDSGALTRCIEQLAADAALRQRLGRAARATAERSFTRRRLTNELVEVYQRIAPDGASTARSSCAQREPLRRRGDISHDPGARGRGCTANVARRLPSASKESSARSSRAHGHRAARAGCGAIEPPAHGVEGPPIPGQAAGQQRIDVVVCHQAWPYAIFGPVIRRARLPLVFWLHTAGDGRHWLERWARRLTPDLAVANSQFTASALSRDGSRMLPLETIYYPLRLHAARCARPPLTRGHPPVARHVTRRSRDRSGRPAGVMEGES